MKDFGVLGSGISGSTIAKLLSNKFSLEVFEKAKGFCKFAHMVVCRRIIFGHKVHRQKIFIFPE